MSLSAPRDDSPGAVDNATGVIAALVAAAELVDRSDVGVLVTDAEELGMDQKDVHVLPIYVGGGFGGKIYNHQALEAAKQAVKLEPDFPMAQNNLAVALYYNGDFKAARKHAEKAIALGYDVDQRFLDALQAELS